MVSLLDIYNIKIWVKPCMFLDLLTAELSVTVHFDALGLTIALINVNHIASRVRRSHFAVIAITVGRLDSGNSVIRIFVALNPSIPDDEQQECDPAYSAFEGLVLVRRIGSKIPMKQR